MKKVYSPWQSLLILLAFTFACSFVVQFLVVGVDLLISRNFDAVLAASDSSGYVDRPVFLYMLLIAGTVGTFLLPPLLLQRIERMEVYFPHAKCPARVFLAFVLFLVAFGPLMESVGNWNQQMSLPESWSALEQWMLEKEQSMALVTAKIVMVDSLPLLLLNIVVMAVLPAIAEEFYFRGALMHIVQRFTKNHHATVWLVAIIFSAIHVQFYGFIPRMLLGVFFGYALVWTQNIWVPVLGHFVNNATVTIVAYYYTLEGKSYAELQQMEGYPIFVYIASFVVAGLVGFWFYKQAMYDKEVLTEQQ